MLDFETDLYELFVLHDFCREMVLGWSSLRLGLSPTTKLFCDTFVLNFGTAPSVPL